MIDFAIVITGFVFGNLGICASKHAKKNDMQHPNQLSLYIHLASTISMFALYAWSILQLDWSIFGVAWMNSAVNTWLGPLAISGALLQLFRFVVISSNWEKFFGAIPITGGVTIVITCVAWAKWMFEL